MTTATEIQRYQPTGARPAVSAAAGVEQTRAVAEVQAAVTVAQSCPRDINRAIHEMQESCSRLAMAEQAFYAVPNRGSGNSVHLLRELARCWGNVQHGSQELRRDDIAGVSEVQAFAWDMQANMRVSRQFITPHERMKGGGRQKLTDLGDIQNNNNNVAARAVRECISASLPKWFVEDGAARCRQTLEHGEGVPLLDRITNMVNLFGTIGVSAAQIEARLEKKRGTWDAGDVASMTIVWKSLGAGEATKAELFPAVASSAADEIAAPPAIAEKPKGHQRKPRTSKAEQPIEAEIVAAAVAADQAEGNTITTPADDKPPTGDRFYREAPAVGGIPVTIDENLPAGNGPVVVDSAVFGGPQRVDNSEPTPAPVMVDFPDQAGDPIKGEQIGLLLSLRARGNYPDTDEGNADWSQLLSDMAERNVGSVNRLTMGEAALVIDILQAADK